MKILVTGTAGFIGFYLARYLSERGDEVYGIDNLNSYYDVDLKYARLRESGFISDDYIYNSPLKSEKYTKYTFIRLDLDDRENLQGLFESQKFDCVCNLAAQAGVRYSITNPYAYITSNISGFLNLLECCRHHPVRHLVYASSSSVYGLNEKTPFSTAQNVDHPVSLYAASKKSNELMAHSYSHLYGIPATGLRFFTVYGPWGRPDMAYFSFTRSILEGKAIDVYNNGNMYRDFTYIDDIIEGVVRAMDCPPRGNALWDGNTPDPGSSRAPYKLYNIGNSAPVNLMDFISAIEKVLGKQARKNFLPMQPGDVYMTYADVTDLMRDLGYRPGTPVEEGIQRFVSWYKKYYKLDT